MLRPVLKVLPTGWFRLPSDRKEVMFGWLKERWVFSRGYRRGRDFRRAGEMAVAARDQNANLSLPVHVDHLR